MDIKMVASRYAPSRCSVNRFFRKLGQFLYYDRIELLVISDWRYRNPTDSGVDSLLRESR